MRDVLSFARRAFGAPGLLLLAIIGPAHAEADVIQISYDDLCTNVICSGCTQCFECDDAAVRLQIDCSGGTTSVSTTYTYGGSTPHSYVFSAAVDHAYIGSTVRSPASLGIVRFRVTESTRFAVSSDMTLTGAGLQRLSVYLRYANQSVFRVFFEAENVPQGTLRVDRSGTLAPDSYFFQYVVSMRGNGSPLTLEGRVTLRLGRPGDTNFDGQMDETDVDEFLSALSGPDCGGGSCDAADLAGSDLDNDGDVDLRDAAIMQGVYELG